MFITHQPIRFPEQKLDRPLASQLLPVRRPQLQPVPQAGVREVRVRLHALRRRRQRPLRHQGERAE